VERCGRNLSLEGEKTLLPQDGAYWQYFYIDRAVFQRIKDAPVDLRTSTAFTLLSAAETTRLANADAIGACPAFGFWRDECERHGGREDNQRRFGRCLLAPFRLPEWSALYIQSRRTGRIEEFGRPQGSIGECNRSATRLRPISRESARQRMGTAGQREARLHGADFDILFESRRALATSSATSEFRGIRLSQ